MKRLGVSLLLLVMCLSIVLPSRITVSAEENDEVVQFSDAEQASDEEIAPMSGGCGEWMTYKTKYIGCTLQNCPVPYYTKEVEQEFQKRRCVRPNNSTYYEYRVIDVNLGCNCPR